MKISLANIKIRTRIYLALCLPLVGLVVFSGLLIVKDFRAVERVEAVRTMADMTPDVSTLVHELQKERGVSAGFIGSKGSEAFRTRVDAQRLETDIANEVFARVFGSFDFAAYGNEFVGLSKQAETMVGQLAEKRTAVSQLEFSVGEMAGYYTGTIAALLNVVEYMITHSSEAELVTASNAYLAILQAKERNGIERAMGAAGFGRGQFAPNIHQRLLSLIGQQEAYFGTYRVNATEEMRVDLATALSAPISQEVDRMRKIAIANGYGEPISGVTGPQWFDTITGKIDLLKGVEDKAAAHLGVVGEGLHNAVYREFVLVVVGAAVLLVLTLIMVFLTVRSITRPMSQIQDAMGILAGGNTEVVIPGVDRKDEIGSMAVAVEVFKGNAIERVRLEIEQKAVAKKTGREKHETMLRLADELESSVGSVITGVTDSAEQMKASAVSMSSIADNASKRSSSVAAASEEATANVQTVATATEELSASVEEISRQVAQSAAMANQAVEKAEQTNAKVEGLSEASQKIGEVVSLINDIAAQTNLLALNATIEASRAGEAGKGFAVVASEVKSLATQTAKATEEIGAQITAIQDETQEAVNAIQGIGASISEISDTTTAIASAVEEQGAATREIAANVQQAASGTQDVSSNISEVSRGVQETGSSAKQVLSSAEHLGSQSEDLQAAVASFLDKVKAA